MERDLINVSRAQKFVYACLLSSVILVVGCGDKSEIRQYQEVRMRSQAPSTEAISLPHAGTRADFTWETPEGWVSLPASGMRLAAFEIERGEAKAICTIITLSGDAGGLAANVERWLGQLSVEAPPRDRLNEILASEEKLKTADDYEGMLIDLGQWVEGDDPARGSMLAGVVAAGPQTLFIKLMGPLNLLAEERANLRSLCISLKTKQ